MPRYIDADKLCEGLKSMAMVQPPDKQSTILGVVSTIENMHTADVVPKSEVAREIFAEIEREFCGAYWYKGYTIERYIAELKKKYTEDQK